MQPRSKLNEMKDIEEEKGGTEDQRAYLDIGNQPSFK